MDRSAFGERKDIRRLVLDRLNVQCLGDITKAAIIVFPVESPHPRVMFCPAHLQLLDIVKNY